MVEKECLASCTNYRQFLVEWIEKKAGCIDLEWCISDCEKVFKITATGKCCVYLLVFLKQVVRDVREVPASVEVIFKCFSQSNVDKIVRSITGQSRSRSVTLGPT